MDNEWDIDIATCKQLIAYQYSQCGENQITGGMLHCQLDDHNIDGGWFEDPFDEETKKIFGREPSPIEVAIAYLMNKMSLKDRCECLGLDYQERYELLSGI